MMREHRQSDLNEPMDAFSDPQVVAQYADGPPRFVPGYHAMQRMTTLLLAERCPDDARVLVLGAGGGLELKAFADAHPGWTFDGVDPSTPMLTLAERMLGVHATRAHLHPGTIDDAPDGPFDAACCLLTMHFMTRDERQRTARAVRQRLKPGGPFVTAHLSFPQDDGARARWLTRHAAFLIASGLDATRPRTRVWPSIPRRTSSRRNRTKPSCARLASPASACSTQRSASAAGWPTPNRPD
jgi:tRNA (cmo5U34)-methyltransferase